MSPVYYICVGVLLAGLIAMYRLSGCKALLHIMYLAGVVVAFKLVSHALPPITKYSVFVLLLLLPSILMLVFSYRRDDCQAFAVVADTELNDEIRTSLELDLRKVLGENASVVAEHDDKGSVIAVILKDTEQLPDVAQLMREVHSSGLLVKEDDDVFRYEPQ